jgi:cytochrome c551/c552
VLTQQLLVRYVEAVPDLPPISETKQVALVDKEPLSPELVRGRTLFDSSSPKKYPGLSASLQTACAACHPDGGSDGAGWGTMEGERRTMSLRGGVSGRGWLHQSATHKDALEFARVLVPERLGGTGLSDSDYEALAKYLAIGVSKLQAPAVNADLAARGASLFQAKCVSCHAGPAFTSGAPDPANAYGGAGSNEPQLYDVGSASSDMQLLLPKTFTKLFPPPSNDLYLELRGDRDLGPGDPVQAVLKFRQRPARKRGQFKAPSLVGVYDYAVFFHDGRAATLEAAVDDIAKRVGVSVSPDERAALVEYLKTL